MPNTETGIAQWARMYPRLTELTRNLALSASDIANILNAEFRPLVRLTRHAVIGKVYRSGLRRSEAAKLKVKPQMPQQAQQLQQAPQMRQMPQMLGLSIMDLVGSSCRWPVAGTGADMRYCGVAEASMPGKPYCRQHARKAHNGKGQGA